LEHTLGLVSISSFMKLDFLKVSVSLLFRKPFLFNMKIRKPAF